jgi:monovalent cation/proton antiporter MnhG/PhaG subunit
MAGLFLLNLILALMWAALQGELNGANLVIGFLVSAALIYLFRRMFFGPLYFRKVALGLTLALVFIKELIKSMPPWSSPRCHFWARYPWRSTWREGRSLIEVIVSLLLLVGLVFTFAGSLGLLRLPDIFCRMHATGKSSTVGVSAIVLASFTYFSASEAGTSINELLTIVFVFLSGPVGAHMIARAAYRSQVPLHERTIVNEWKTIEEDIGEPHRDA